MKVIPCTIFLKILYENLENIRFLFFNLSEIVQEINFRISFGKTRNKYNFLNM